MGVLRSDEIIQLKLRMPGDMESAVQIMNLLGKIQHDTIEFIDLTKDDIDAKKIFEPMLNRCEIMEHTIVNLTNHLKEFNQTIHAYSSYHQFITDLTNDQKHKQVNHGSYFDTIEAEVIDIDRKMLELIDSYNKIKEDFIIELEKQLVFEKLLTMMEPSNGDRDLKHIVGIIQATEDIKMRRMILRTTHGRGMVTFFDFYYPNDLQFSFAKNNKIQKKIFIIFYPSDEKDLILKKINQVCDVLNVSTYRLPEDMEGSAYLQVVNDNIKEKKEYLIQSEGAIVNVFLGINGSEDKPGLMDMYRLFFKKERMVYVNLSKCLFRENFIDGEVWVLADQKDYLQRLLLGSNLNSGNDDNEKNDNDDNISKAQGTFIELETNDFDKPTHIPINDFLYPFQEIVNTYGIPRYQEINPAFFNIVTFPFLFGIMYGDIAHGLIIFSFALYLCITFNTKSYNPKQSSSFLRTCIKIRYFLLLLGLSSIYCGILYNEFLSVPLPVFGTCYDNNPTTNEAIKRANCVYPIGLDPKWYISINELTFVNSFKMKFSVIFGVIHMIFGIGLKGVNDLHYDNLLNFFFEFLPQVIFMLLLFGYMVIMIIIKWITDWSSRATEAPSIITIMINIFIKKGSVDNMPLWGEKEDDQGYFQEKYNFTILLVMIIMIPLMIFPKPIIEYYIHRKHMRTANNNNMQQGNHNINQSNIKKHVDHIDKTFLDFLIQQSIEMIEFILGTVSNTASYLRLWALSLAHVELTKVFIEKTMLIHIQEGDFQFGLSFLELFLGYFLFANITFVVLICMDFMECFLHTLRLHWVEFQTKFFKADGYLFKPYSFRYLIRNEDEL